jgi:hypothetical protein
VDIGGLPRIDRSVEGVVELMLDATQNYGLRSPTDGCSPGMLRCFRPDAA